LAAAVKFSKKKKEKERVKKEEDGNHQCNFG
jgi:hypothetical protein